VGLRECGQAAAGGLGERAVARSHPLGVGRGRRGEERGHAGTRAPWAVVAAAHEERLARSALGHGVRVGRARGCWAGEGQRGCAAERRVGHGQTERGRGEADSLFHLFSLYIYIYFEFSLDLRFEIQIQTRFMSFKLIHIKTHRHTKMNTPACDATIIIPLGFYFTTLNIYIYIYMYIYIHTHTK
jgi:hypothetical protein